MSAEVQMAVLVLTDVEGSTRLWQDEPDAMDAAMRRHHAIVHAAIAQHGGRRPVDQGEGDAVFGAFSSAAAAVAAVTQMQRELAAQAWPTSRPLLVRVAVHVGEVRARDGNLYGEPVNRCARMRALASGGQTLLSGAVVELVRDHLPTGASTTDLGEHRMKDLTRPIQVYQLDVAGLPSQFPPLASLDRLRHNLPVQPAPFIGRDHELAALAATVRVHRLVTLTGFGGMGKTRLALQAAGQLAGDPDIGDIWFVDLAAVSDPQAVPARVAETVGVRFGTEQPAAALTAAMRDRPALLLLDNVEQVIDCAPFVAELVAAVPTLRVLVTSREPLRVRSEIQVPVPPMALPAESTPTDALSAFEAVRFFVDRARAVRPDFALTNDTARHVAHICARLDGHPLAIELAASRVKLLEANALLQRLDTALNVLTGGSRDMPERHRTLRATIAWSFDAGEADEQRLLTRLSVLPAAADLEMIEAVCGDGLDVLSLLEHLVERSLVRTTEVDGQTRFDLLVSVREFAREHLDEAIASRLRERHAEHVQHLLDRTTSWQPKVALVAREVTHVRDAIRFRRESGDRAAEAALIVGIDDGLVHGGHLAEVLELTSRALENTDDAKQRAVLLSNRGMAFVQLGRRADARECYLEGLACARACAWPILNAALAVSAVATAKTLAEAEACAQEYDELRPVLNSEWRGLLDFDLTQRLSDAVRYVDPARAEELARKSMDLPMGNAVGRVRLARVLLDHGRVDDAWQVLEPLQSGEMFVGMQGWLYRGLTELARCLLARGESRLAEETAGRAFDGVLTLGALPHEPAVVLAEIHRRAGSPQRAGAVLDQALASATDPASTAEAGLRWRRGMVHLDAGDAELARPQLEDAHAVLAADDLQGPLELLGCCLAEALLLADDKPAAAASLLAQVAERRGSWVLPFGMDAVADTLRERLWADVPAALEPQVR